MPARLIGAAVLCAVCSCHTGSPNTWTGVAVMTTAATAASAATRASGGCYAVCQQGEQCNPRSGLCEALPCRGKCAASETCEEGFFGIKCIPGAPLSVTSQAQPAAAKEPAGPALEKKPPVPDAAVPR